MTERKLEVAIGAEFKNRGGLLYHLRGLHSFSSHRTRLFPSDTTRALISINRRFRRLYQHYVQMRGLPGFDIVHSHVDPWFVAACSRAHTTTCKWVHTYHTLYFAEDYPGGLNPGQEVINSTLLQTVPEADVKISISRWLHDYLLENHSIETVIIPNGVDCNECDTARGQRFEKEYDLKDFILFVGSSNSVKNPWLFVKLAGLFPASNFVMIGPGLTGRQFITRSGSLPGNLSLLGELPRGVTLDAMAACSTLVTTSKREGIPTVLLEAMYLGKPVVAPGHTGCREIIARPEVGFLYDPGDFDSLVETVKTALAAGSSIGEMAKNHVRSTYDWSVVVKHIDRVYNSCMV